MAMMTGTQPWRHDMHSSLAMSVVRLAGHCPCRRCLKHADNCPSKKVSIHSRTDMLYRLSMVTLGHSCTGLSTEQSHAVTVRMDVFAYLLTPIQRFPDLSHSQSTPTLGLPVVVGGPHLCRLMHRPQHGGISAVDKQAWCAQPPFVP